MDRIIIDMDEVIADTMGKVVNWYVPQYGDLINYNRMEMGSWLKGFPKEHHSMIKEMVFQPGFFRDIPVMEDAQEVLAEMNKRYEIFIVSAAIEFPDSLKDKLEWLLEHFPFFSWRQLVLCGDKKMIHGDYMIDDIDRNLKHFNGKKFLFSAAHNKACNDYPRLESWKHAAEIFL